MCLQEKTIVDYLRDIADQKPEKCLLGGEQGWQSAAEILRRTEQTARRLLALGLCPGDPILLRAGKSPESAVMLLAARAAGLLVVLADPRGDACDILDACEMKISVRAILEQEADSEWIVKLTGQTVIHINSGHLDSEHKAHDQVDHDYDFAYQLPVTTATEPAFVIFTSGSSGKSKAVVLCEKNLISNLIASKPLGDYRKDDIALGVLPLVHVFGLVLLFGVFALEYRLYLPGKTDISSVLTCIQKERITRMNGVPSLYLAMAEGSIGYDLSSLRCGFIGGGPITAEQFLKTETKLCMTLIPVYGMSENIGIACSDYRDAQEIRAAGASKLYPENRCMIRTEEGRVAKTGEEGEIWVAGPMRMLGYYGIPMPEEELFPTGDIGYLDSHGLLHLSGRKKEIIIRNGNNISPRRIEEVLLSQPGVRAAAVVGIADPLQGEVPCAIIVGQIDLQKLSKLLPKNEIPENILRVEEIPLTASGKKDLQKIKEMIHKQLK